MSGFFDARRNVIESITDALKRYENEKTEESILQKSPKSQEDIDYIHGVFVKAQREGKI